MDDDQFCCIGIVALVFIVILFSWDLGAGIVGTIVTVLIIGAIYDSKKSDEKSVKEKQVKEKEAEKKRIKMEKELERFKQKEEDETKIKQLKQKIRKMKDDGYNVDELEESLEFIE